MGGTMLGLGIWMAVDPNAGDILGIAVDSGVNDSLYWASVYMMIGIGAGVFLLGFLGCVGALRVGKGGNCFLKLYFILVKIIIFAEIVSIILVAIFWTSLNDAVRDDMYRDVHNYYVNETSDDIYSKSWNKMQKEWKCCGSWNHTDYRQSNYSKTTGHTVPWTCCLMIDDLVVNLTQCRAEANKASINPSDYSVLHPTGCYDALVNFVDENSAIIIGVTCGFIGLQILGSIMACILMKKGND